VKRLCGGVQIGAGRLGECLRQNDANLSPACKTKRAEADARFRALVDELAKACLRDAQRLCGQLKQGRGRVVACLQRQQDDLSTSCHSEIDRVQEAADKVSAIRAACRADAERLCAGAGNDAGALVECLQANRENLSDACRSLDPQKTLASAELVDAVESLKTEERSVEAQQILQGIESIAFARSQILFQIDTFEGVGGVANADRLIFNPQIAFGDRRQYSIQLKAPLITVYPYAADHPAQTGLGAVNTSVAWAFLDTPRVHQYASLGLQWISPERPPIGTAWAVLPGYAISVGLARWLSLTGQVVWARSFASSGYPELNILLLEPIVVVNLPGRTFLSADTRVACQLTDSSCLTLLKGIVGLYVDRRKAVSISAWYQRVLSSHAQGSTDPGALTFNYGVGTALSYFFDW
jgi:hypothetical protein